MRIIYDASNHQLYPIGSEGFTSGTVVMVRQIAAGLAERGHTVHVITNDLYEEEQRGPNLWYWPKDNHPTRADVVVQLMHVNPNANYDIKLLLLSTFGVDPYLGPDHEWAAQVDGFPVLSAKHGELLRQTRPTVAEAQCFVTGLGVELDDYPDKANGKVPGRLLFSNDPTRGLSSLLDIFDIIRKHENRATLHITYDFDRNHNLWAWDHSLQAQMLWECKLRVEQTPGIVNLGAVSRADIIHEQLECQIHAMPSWADNDQLHGLSQMECAAAGAALVLSDVAAFPEVFGEGAIILPQVGKYIEGSGRRCDAGDWAEVIIELMRDPAKWQEQSRKARALAERNTWERCIDKWEGMLNQLMEEKGA